MKDIKKLFLFLLFPFVILARPVMYSNLSKTALHTGDTLTLKVMLKDTLKLKYFYPVKDTSLGDFVLLGAKEINDGNETDIDFKLLFKGVDKDSIPSFNILYAKDSVQDTLSTPVVYTDYISLVKHDSTNSIKNDEPQAKIKHNLLFYAVMFLFLILVVILIIFVIYYIKKKLKKTAGVVEKDKEKSVKEIVLEMLGKLTMPEISDEDAIKEFYYKLSYILRYFIDGNFGTNTKDMTSSEFIKTLRKINIDKEDISKIRDNIYRFDMIKYAADTRKGKIESDLNFVRAFIEKYFIEEKENDESSSK